MKRLAQIFYARDALTVAENLIGCLFVRDAPTGRIAVRIVETEAYRGHNDPGSHGYRGVTPRTEIMYGPPGYLYVYFTYGMHWCANVVCGRDGECEAVLLRAGEPVLGEDLMLSNRPGITNRRMLASGPARMAQALGIDKRHNGATLLRGGEFFCAEDAGTDRLRDGPVARTTRIGLAAGRGDDIPWRFVVKDHPHASRRS